MAKNDGAQYDDAIQFAAKEFGVNPDILHGIAYAESRYNANTPPSSAGVVRVILEASLLKTLKTLQILKKEKD